MIRPSLQHLFAQWADTDRVGEAARVDGVDAPERRSFPAPWLRRSGAGARRVQRVVGEILHAAAFGLYLSPALILGRLGPRAVGDVCVICFVILVLAFFALLNLYIVVAVIAWRRSRRPVPIGFELPFTRRGGDALDLLAGGAGVVSIAAGVDDAVAGAGDTIRVRGVATRLAATHGAEQLIDDLWFPESKPRYRVCGGADFVVEGEDQIPVVVRLSSAPVVIARPAAEPRRVDDDLAAGELLAACGIDSLGGGGVQLGLVEGDRVELLGVVDRVLEDVGTFELDGRMRSLVDPGELGSPYRRGAQGAGLVVRSSPERPCVIRLLAGRPAA